MPAHRCVVNGQEVRIEVPDDMPLLWVLRDLLQLTGTKYGCGIQQCGACTVHLDGEPVRSCGIAMREVAGRSVTTIEGLGGGSLHPVQQAWIQEQVAQCGYCQSGQIMAAAALLRKSPQPSRAAVDRAMAGHICRCGTYARIRRAIEAARTRIAATAARAADAGAGARDGDAGAPRE